MTWVGGRLVGGLERWEVGEVGRETDIEVLGVDFLVFGEVEVLFGDEDTLC